MTAAAARGSSDAARHEVFEVRERRGLRGVRRLLTCLLLVAVSAAFVGGGLARGLHLAGLGFAALGAIGLMIFGAGLLGALADTFAPRPVFELDSRGVHRRARWPRRGTRTLPWSQVEALCVMRRAGASRRGTDQDYLIFLPDAEAAETARSAPRPQLVALTLTDLPVGARTAPWCFPVTPSWRVTLKETIAAARRHRDLRLIDRRKT